MERPNAWQKYNDDDKKKVFDFAEKYRQFISEADYQPFIRWYKNERALRIWYHTFYTRDFQFQEKPQWKIKRNKIWAVLERD